MLIWTYEEKWGEAPEHIADAVTKLSVNETIMNCLKL